MWFIEFLERKAEAAAEGEHDDPGSLLAWAKNEFWGRLFSYVRRAKLVND